MEVVQPLVQLLMLFPCWSEQKGSSLTVLNEKELSSELPAAELSKYLERRGIDATPDCIDAAGRRIGEI